MIVSELAHRSGLPPHVVRYYARIGLLAPERNPENGYKLFSQDDVVRIRFIRQAQSLGFTLDEIQEILTQGKNGHVPCPMVREILAQRIEENHQQIEVLLEKQQRMERAMEHWNAIPDQSCGSGTICHLIEGVDETPRSA